MIKPFIANILNILNLIKKSISSDKYILLYAKINNKSNYEKIINLCQQFDESSPMNIEHLNSIKNRIENFNQFYQKICEQKKSILILCTDNLQKKIEDINKLLEKIINDYFFKLINENQIIEDIKLINVNNYDDRYQIISLYLQYLIKFKKLNLIDKKNFNKIIPDICLLVVDLKLEKIAKHFEQEFKEEFLNYPRTDFLINYITEKYDRKNYDYVLPKLSNKEINELIEKYLNEEKNYPQSQLLIVLKTHKNNKKSYIILDKNKKNIDNLYEKYENLDYYDFYMKETIKYENYLGKNFFAKHTKTENEKILYIESQIYIDPIYVLKNSSYDSYLFCFEKMFKKVIHEIENTKQATGYDILQFFAQLARQINVFIEKKFFSFQTFIDNLIFEINSLIKQKGYLHRFEFCHFSDYNKDALLNCLKIFLGIECLIKQYQDYIKDWSRQEQLKSKNEKIYDYQNCLNRNYSFKFKNLKGLNDKKIFSKLESRCLSYLLYNEQDDKEESLALRNRYAHNIVFYEKNIRNINQFNFCIGLFILINILIKIKYDINENLKSIN